MEEPILELRALEGFIEGVLVEGEDGGDDGEGEMEMESKSGRSTFLDTVLNQSDDINFLPSFTGTHELEERRRRQQSPAPMMIHRHLPADADAAGSPSYSPPASPSLSFETLLQRTDIPPSTPSSILSKPAPIIHHHHRRSANLPLQGTTTTTISTAAKNWKLDLHARKGYPIHAAVVVGPVQRAVLTRCLALVRAATGKAEECVRTIGGLKELSEGMRDEWCQWEVVCEELEDDYCGDDDDDNDDVEMGMWIGRDYGRRGGDDQDDDDGDETEVEDWMMAGRRTGSFRRVVLPRSRSRSPSRSSQMMELSDDGKGAAAAATEKVTRSDTRLRSEEDEEGGEYRDDGELYRPDRDMDVDVGGDDEEEEDEMEGLETEEEEDDDVDDDRESGGKEKKEKEEKKGLRSAWGGMMGLYGEEY